MVFARLKRGPAHA